MENSGNRENTSATQAEKALQAKVLGNERSDLLSATIFFDPGEEKKLIQEMKKERERERETRRKLGYRNPTQRESREQWRRLRLRNLASRAVSVSSKDRPSLCYENKKVVGPNAAALFIYLYTRRCESLSHYINTSVTSLSRSLNWISPKSYWSDRTDMLDMSSG